MGLLIVNRNDRKKLKQIRTFSDERLNNFCAYCGEIPDTRDHVPSKILLDKPFPENLPVVPACENCNHSFSLDEEYFGCILECILRGTTEPKELERSKIAKILKRKEKLKKRLDDAKKVVGANTSFEIEEDRFINVILKLAQGHYRFENSESQIEKPTTLWFQALDTMTENEKREFFSLTEQTKMPEVGSRAMMVLFSSGVAVSKWITVQPNNYEYSVSYFDSKFIVKILIWGYLACQIEWHQV